MSLSDRAAQFSPFAALTGHSAAIQETAWLTEERAALDESILEELNWKLTILKDRLPGKPLVTITWFEEDQRKSGGRYQTVTSRIQKIDEARQLLTLEDGTAIPMQQIYNMEF